MKTKRITWLGVLICCTVCLFSCKKEKPAEDVAGSYQGTLVMSVSGAQQGSFDTTIVLQADNDEKVSILFPAIGEGRMSVPEFRVKGVQVNEASDNKYTLSETAIEFTSNEVTWAGKVSGKVTNNKLHLDYSLQPGAMPMTIDFAFDTK